MKFGGGGEGNKNENEEVEAEGGEKGTQKIKPRTDGLSSVARTNRETDESLFLPLFFCCSPVSRSTARTYERKDRGRIFCSLFAPPLFSSTSFPFLHEREEGTKGGLCHT